MSFTLRVVSHRSKAPKGARYLASWKDFQLAFEGLLTADAWVDLTFATKQAFWKEDRDRIAATGAFKVLRATYTTVHRLTEFGAPRPWDSESNPQLIEAEVFAVPVDATPKGVAARPIVSRLLAAAAQRLNPVGLPATKPMKHLHAWLLEVEFDVKNTNAVARLLPWNGGAYALAERLAVPLRNPFGDAIDEFAGTLSKADADAVSEAVRQSDAADLSSRKGR